MDHDVSDSCAICGAVGTFDRYTLREMLFGLREQFLYRRCSACGVLWIDQVPADLGRHYPDAYFGSGAPADRRSRRSGLTGAMVAADDADRLFGNRPLVRLVRRFLPAPSAAVTATIPLARAGGLRSFDDPILDVGCGRVPSALARLREAGFTDLLGIDPYLEHDVDVDGIPLRKRSIHDQTGAFRLITFHHSFEHVTDPLSTLRSAARLLRPGGTVLIRTPVMGTWFWSTYGTDWWELDPPRHLFVHTQASLVRLATDAGLQLTHIRWDSTATEIIASEQIRVDVAWHEPRSWRVAPPGDFTPESVREYRALARRLNAEGIAGRAGFYFRHAADLPRGGAA